MNDKRRESIFLIGMYITKIEKLKKRNQELIDKSNQGKRFFPDEVYDNDVKIQKLFELFNNTTDFYKKYDKELNNEQ